MKPVESFGYLLQHVAFMFGRQSDQVLQERLGIGMAQYRLLMMLEDEPGAQQRRLAERLGQTEASISRQIKLLQQKGMLAVQVNAKNRRQHITLLTPKGTTVAEAAREILANYHAQFLTELTPKQQQLFLDTLATLHAHACQEGKPGGCAHPFESHD